MLLIPRQKSNTLEIINFDKLLKKTNNYLSIIPTIDFQAQIIFSLWGTLDSTSSFLLSLLINLFFSYILLKYHIP